MSDRSMSKKNPVTIDVLFFLVCLPLNTLSHPVAIFRVHELPSSHRTWSRSSLRLNREEGTIFGLRLAGGRHLH